MNPPPALQAFLTGAAALTALSAATAQTPERANGLPAKARWQTAVEKSAPGQRQQFVRAGILAREIERQKVLTTWQGTTVTPRPGAGGETLALHREIAAQFSRQGPSPDARRRHFEWCEREGFVHQGWTGNIVKTVPVPGGVHVQVRVQPLIVSEVVRMSDHFLETYEYSQGTLRFLEGEGPDPRQDGGLLRL